MKRISFLFIAISLLAASCSPALKSTKIVYNNKKQTFEYQINKNTSVPLRNEDHSLVDNNSIDDFRNELALFNNEYPMGSRSENTFMLKKDDYEIASVYRDANIYLKKKDFASTLENLSILHQMYPNIYKYSDYSFMKGYCFDRMQQKDSAAHYYTEFLNFSTQKYSARFHGYASADINQESYIWQRDLARQRLNDEAENERYIPDPITPKYYYASFQPGYSFNKGDNPQNVKGALMLMISDNIVKQPSAGLQMCFYLSDLISISPGISYSKDVWEASLALPMQVYKSENNRIGLKLTPFFEARRLLSPPAENPETGIIEEFDLNTNWLTFGGRASAGYYIMPKLSLGAYYQYNYHNDNNPFQTDYNLEFGLNNEYDISAFYNISKSISLKAGVKNNDIVAGIFVTGWEVSYNFTSPGIIFRTKMY